MKQLGYIKSCLLRSIAILFAVFFLQWGQTSTVQAAAPIDFNGLYSSVSSQGYEISDYLLSLQGQEVTITGFMAPPLKPTINFFVLSSTPLAICPFCSSDADWPQDIVVVTLDSPVVALPYDTPIQVTGTLEVGSAVDPDTGFVSLIRVRANSID